MAYMTKNGNGPCPNKAGEYCGNHLVGSRPMLLFGESQQQAEEKQERWLATMRFGRPRACQAGTSEEMHANGLVGLYLKNDSERPLSDGEVEIPTPPELTEPPSPA